MQKWIPPTPRIPTGAQTQGMRSHAGFSVLIIFMVVAFLILGGIILKRQGALKSDAERDSEYADYGPEGKTGYEKRSGEAQKKALKETFCRPTYPTELTFEEHNCIANNSDECLRMRTARNEPSWSKRTKEFCAKDSASALAACSTWISMAKDVVPNRVRELACSAPQTGKGGTCRMMVTAAYECRSP